jgi:hypothetical protein
MIEEEYNTEGKPIKIHELDIIALADWLKSHDVRTTQGKLIQSLHEGHIEVLEDEARFKVLACGRRWGKTLLTSLIALAVLMQMNRRVWIVAPDYSLTEKVFRELYNILVTQLKIIKPGKPGGGRARNQKGDYYLQTPWGSVLEAKSMENPDSLAGEANDLVIVDEAAITPNIDDIWTQMIQPTLMDKEGSAVFISTPRGKNGFHKMFMFGKVGNRQRSGKLSISMDEVTGVSNDMTEWSSFQRTSYDNPLLAATPGKSKTEIDSAYRRAVLSGKVTKFKQEYLADFEAVADSCFPGFMEEETKEKPFPHVVDYKWHPDEGPVFASCDHNFAKPASTIFAQINSYGDVIVFDERFTPHTTTYMQGQQILNKQAELNRIAIPIFKEQGKPLANRDFVGFDLVIADVSGDQRQLNGRAAWDDIESVLGVRPVGLKQPRDIGCNLIRQWMNFPQFGPNGQPLKDEKSGEHVTVPKLFITRNCVNLIHAISTAVFKKAKGGALKEDYEETVEGYEGLLDALRYLMVYLFHDTGQHITVIQGVQ